jgi:RNase P/RNase MRP subunit p30
MQRTYLAIDLRGYPSPLYQNVCHVRPVEDYLPESAGSGVIHGVEVETVSQLKGMPGSVLVFARGGTGHRNRTFLRTRRINVLSCPYPFDSFQARLAAENHTAVELCFADVLFTTGYHRGRVLKRLSTTVSLSRKYHAPLIITSGASCEREVVAPRTLVAFGRILGMEYDEAKASIWNIPKKVLEGFEW